MNDFPGMRALAALDRAAFAAAEPYPHAVVDGFLDPDWADRVAAEFAGPAVAWKAYRHVNERKGVASDAGSFGPATQRVVTALQSPALRDALGALLGVDGLAVDPRLDGSGLHVTEDGGFLNVHADHLVHTTRRTWIRQANLLLFLNRDWDSAWGGQLELWSPDAQRCVRRIEPGFNRCVVFRVSEASFHGVVPVRCPQGQSRKSVAVYYYRDGGRPGRLRPTRYVPRPDDSRAKRLAIHADRWAVAAYSLLKRYTPIDDAMVSRLLRRF